MHAAITRLIVTNYLLKNWIPFRLFIVEGIVYCRWLYVDEQPFDAPFFDETEQACMRYPANSSQFKSVSSLDWLIEVAQTIPSVPLTAFIFHVSRCGSTLLSQLLTLSNQHIVLAEVPLLDALLRLPELVPAIDPAYHEQGIRAAVRLLGQQRRGHETSLFIKLDSWHIYFHDLLYRIFPTVPVVLLYRSPDAVIQSHQQQRGMHAVPGLLPAYLFGLDPATVTSIDTDTYTAQVLTAYYRQFGYVAQQDSPALLLHYQPDGPALFRSLMTFLHLSMTDAEWAAIEERSRFHAKKPKQTFDEVVLAKPVPDYLLPALSAYEQLTTWHSNVVN